MILCNFFAELHLQYACVVAPIQHGQISRRAPERAHSRVRKFSGRIVDQHVIDGIGPFRLGRHSAVKGLMYALVCLP